MRERVCVWQKGWVVVNIIRSPTPEQKAESEPAAVMDHKHKNCTSVYYSSNTVTLSLTETHCYKYFLFVVLFCFATI